jgi:hypothetical protein
MRLSPLCSAKYIAIRALRIAQRAALAFSFRCIILCIAKFSRVLPDVSGCCKMATHAALSNRVN